MWHVPANENPELAFREPLLLLAVAVETALLLPLAMEISMISALLLIEMFPGELLAVVLVTAHLHAPLVLVTAQVILLKLMPFVVPCMALVRLLELDGTGVLFVFASAKVNPFLTLGAVQFLFVGVLQDPALPRSMSVSVLVLHLPMKARRLVLLGQVMSVRSALL